MVTVSIRSATTDLAASMRPTNGLGGSSAMNPPLCHYMFTLSILFATTTFSALIVPTSFEAVPVDWA